MPIPVITPQILDFNRLAIEAAQAEALRQANLQAATQGPLRRAILQQQIQRDPLLRSQMEATTRLRQAQTAVAPEIAQSRLQTSQFLASPGRNLRGIINSPAMLSLISSNPQIANEIGTALANNAVSLSHQQAPGSPPLTPNDVSMLQRNAKNTLIRRQNTANILNQRTFASNLDALFDQGLTELPSVSKYVGLAGKLPKTLESARSVLGATSPDYANYLFFTRQTVKLIANDMRRALGGAANEQEQREMNNIANPDFWDSNPTQASAQFKHLVSIFKNRIDPNLAKDLGQTKGFLKQQTTAPATIIRGAQTGVAPQTAQRTQLSPAEIRRLVNIVQGGQ